MRTYTDPEGTVWMVYLVAPSGGTSPRLLPAEYQSGWICFEAADSKRRLAPIPEDWESCAETRLELYRVAAMHAERAVPAVAPVLPRPARMNEPREEFRLMRLRAAVLLARSREARARATRALEHARLLRADSADLRQFAAELRESCKRPGDP